MELASSLSTLCLQIAGRQQFRRGASASSSRLDYVLALTPGSIFITASVRQKPLPHVETALKLQV